jgi:hypothetical protein
VFKFGEVTRFGEVQAYIEYLGMSIGYIPKKLSIYGIKKWDGWFKSDLNSL